MYSVIETKTSLVGIDPVRVMRTYIYICVYMCSWWERWEEDSAHQGQTGRTGRMHAHASFSIHIFTTSKKSPNF